jgi:hypothetical protein
VAAAPKGAKTSAVKAPKSVPQKQEAAKKASPAQPAKLAKTAAPTAAATRSQPEILAEQLAQLDLKFENGELSDEAAYRRVREQLVQQLVNEVASDPTALT